MKKAALITVAIAAVLGLAFIWWSGAGTRSVDDALGKLRYDDAVAAVDRLYEQSGTSAVVPPELAIVTTQIRRAEEGVYLPTHRRFVQEDGLFILRRDSTFRPEEKGDPHFERVRDRLYRYHVSG
jgi:hypothetical protein